MVPSKVDPKIERTSAHDRPDDEAQLEPAALSQALKGRYMQMIAIGQFIVHLTPLNYCYPFCRNQSRRLHRRWFIRRFGDCISQCGAGQRGEFS